MPYLEIYSKDNDRICWWSLRQICDLEFRALEFRWTFLHIYSVKGHTCEIKVWNDHNFTVFYRYDITFDIKPLITELLLWGASNGPSSCGRQLTDGGVKIPACYNWLHKSSCICWSSYPRTDGLDVVSVCCQVCIYTMNESVPQRATDSTLSFYKKAEISTHHLRSKCLHFHVGVIV
jgi:hypothetical protein